MQLSFSSSLLPGELYVLRWWQLSSPCRRFLLCFGRICLFFYRHIISRMH